MTHGLSSRIFKALSPVEDRRIRLAAKRVASRSAGYIVAKTTTPTQQSAIRTIPDDDISNLSAISSSLSALTITPKSTPKSSKEIKVEIKKIPKDHSAAGIGGNIVIKDDKIRINLTLNGTPIKPYNEPTSFIIEGIDKKRLRLEIMTNHFGEDLRNIDTGKGSTFYKLKHATDEILKTIEKAIEKYKKPKIKKQHLKKSR